MNSQRKCLSGHDKRKKAKQLQLQISKLPKISELFKAEPKHDCDTDENDQYQNVGITDDQSDRVNIDKRIPEEHTEQQSFEQDEGEQTAGLKKESLSENAGHFEIQVENRSFNSTQETDPGNLENENLIELYESDPALWKVNNNLIMYCLSNGPAFCQNRDGKYEKSAREYAGNDEKKITRYLQSSLFYRPLTNGEKIERDWLLYSPSTGCIYCFICRLFSSKNSQFSFSGFSDWKNGLRRVKEHEEGSEHKECLISYSQRKSAAGCIDDRIIHQAKQEELYWRELLQHLIKAIKFLASRGLAFRGENQDLGSTKNGNYLGIIELLSDYSPFIKNHLAIYGNKGHGSTSYLSANICEELIQLMGNRVLEYILTELKEAKYYSISVDSTPDKSKRDQLTFIIRYVTNEGPIERFLQFIEIESHGSEHLENTVIDFLDNKKVPLDDCRGQSYDNAKNMSGQYSGLQARIKKCNDTADYVPCAGHSLNLVGSSAAACNLIVILFFALIQELYVFLSDSTHRWKKLTNALGSILKVLKSLSKTRWSARHDAVSAVHDGYHEILSVLVLLSEDKTAKDEHRAEALGLHNKLTQFQNIFLLVVWNEILSRIHASNLTIQKANIDLSTVVNILKSLVGYITGLRDEFDQFLRKAKDLAFLEENEEVPMDESSRIRTRSVRLRRFEGPSADTTFSHIDKLKIEIFYQIIDSLTVNLNQRMEAYDKLHKNFSFLRKLQTLNDNEIKENCVKLAHKYQKDICEKSLIVECIQFKYYLIETGAEKDLSFKDLYVKINEGCVRSTFPNLEIILRIFLCMMVTNCSGERSFSALKHLKNDHRSTMSDKRLNALTLMYIESDILDLIDFNDIIEAFANKKSRSKL